MKPIILPVTELKSALSGLSKIIPSRTTLPVLATVKVERTSEGWIALTTTDLDRWLTVRFEHPSEGSPASVLVPLEQLQQLTKNCGRNEQLQIVPTSQGPVIKFALADQLGETKVAQIPLTDFPATPRLKMDPIPLPPELRRSITQAMDCASTDATRYILNSTFIDASNPKANYIVGTDGRHLYSANSFSLPLKNSVLIPNHKFLGWKEFNLDGEWQLRADTEHVQLSSRRWRFISRQIDGKYPDWRMTVPAPDSAKTVITFDPAKLDVLTRLVQRMPCHEDRHQSLGLEWKGGQFFLLGKDKPEESWTRVPVQDLKGDGPEVTIFLDRRFFIKALSYGLNTLALIDEISPLRFYHNGRQMIVMPVRPESSPSTLAKSAPEPVSASRTSPPHQPPHTKPMLTSEAPPPIEGKSATEEAIDLTLLIRDKFNEGLNMLRDLSIKLKVINRDQKTSAREFNSVRSTLRSIQGLKL